MLNVNLKYKSNGCICTPLAFNSGVKRLRIKGLYMLQALLAHPQEAIQSGTWNIACVLCQLAAPGMKWNFNPGAAN
jgi:hypothetical protein